MLANQVETARPKVPGTGQTATFKRGETIAKTENAIPSEESI
jgi:hypothetical protein